MPRPIPREEALRRIGRERDGAGCFICGLLDGTPAPVYVLDRTPRTTVILSRYPRKWGHLMVLVNDHVTSFSDLPAAAWDEAARQARRAARVLERALRPLRCYVASLGSPHETLPMSSPHLHLHVVPIEDPEEKPGLIFTWEAGVLEAEPAEWEALHAELLRLWPDA